MTGFACFNELSTHPLCQNNIEARQRLDNFIKLIKEVRAHTGISKIRHADDLASIPLMQDMSLRDFCNANMRDSSAILLMSMFIKPQVDMENDAALENYLDTTTYLQAAPYNEEEADGFNAAYTQSTFCIGFDSAPVWDNDFFDLKVVSNGGTRYISWACISSLNFYSPEAAHRQRRPAFDRWLQDIRPVTLLESKIEIGKKGVNLRDDHGKDKLTEHAQQLCRHKYVDGILTSLKFQPGCKSYIYKIHDDGTIDIVLYWHDEGYSMRVKTTGRNAAETKSIAEILAKKYGKK